MQFEIFARWVDIDNTCISNSTLNSWYILPAVRYIGPGHYTIQIFDNTCKDMINPMCLQKYQPSDTYFYQLVQYTIIWQYCQVSSTSI